MKHSANRTLIVLQVFAVPLLLALMLAVRGRTLPTFDELGVESQSEVRRINALIEKGMFEPASKSIDDYRQKFGNENKLGLATINWLSGRLEYARGNNAKAMALFGKAAEFDPKEPVYLVDLASSLHESFRWMEASDLMIKARRKFPYSTAVLNFGSPSLPSVQAFEKVIRSRLKARPSPELEDALGMCQVAQQETNCAWTFLDAIKKAPVASLRGRLHFLLAKTYMPNLGGTLDLPAVDVCIDQQLEVELQAASSRGKRAELRDLVRAAMALGRAEFAGRAARQYCSLYETTPEFVLYSCVSPPKWDAFRKVMAATNDRFYRDELESELLVLQNRIVPDTTGQSTKRLLEVLYRGLSPAVHSNWRYLACTELSLRHYAQAQKCFEEYQKLEPLEGETPYFIAICLVGRGLQKEALQLLAKTRDFCAPQHDIQLTAFSRELAERCRTDNDKPGYRTYALEALRNCPLNDPLFTQYCLEAKAENLEVDITHLPAYRSYTQICDMPEPSLPHGPRALQEIARLFRIGQLENWSKILSAYNMNRDAIVLLQKVLQMDSNHYATHLELAQLYLKQGDRQEAAQSLTAAMRICKATGGTTKSFWNDCLVLAGELNLDCTPWLDKWLAGDQIDPVLLDKVLRRDLSSTLASTVATSRMADAANALARSKADTAAFVALTKQNLARMIQLQCTTDDLAAMFVACLPALEKREMEVAEVFPVYLAPPVCLAVINRIVDRHPRSALLKMRAALLKCMGKDELANQDLNRLKVLKLVPSATELAGMQNKYSQNLSDRERDAINAVRRSYINL